MLAKPGMAANLRADLPVDRGPPDPINATRSGLSGREEFRSPQ
jgi:hypothetical protein